jgi:hypothetical protein
MSFDSDLNRFIERTGIEADIAIRKIVFDGYKMVTKKTPVDTGRARANWNVSVGSIDRGVNEEARSTKTPMLRKGDGLKTTYIVNSLPYIHALETGSSTQAPNGMVTVTVNELRSYFK